MSARALHTLGWYQRLRLRATTRKPLQALPEVSFANTSGPSEGRNESRQRLEYGKSWRSQHRARRKGGALAEKGLHAGYTDQKNKKPDRNGRAKCLNSLVGRE